ncbi:MAG: heme NO-binding domain-containing protein [Oceanospirillaceae bacterium]|nr:heme NO-binding domain-containing protein [Oceanospirillaceae bacterium]
MKGVVFVELLEMAEETFGMAKADEIIQGANLPNGGAYTAVGTYPHEEAVNILVSANKVTGIEIPVLLKQFGHHLFGVFSKGYPAFFEGMSHPFDLLEKVDDYIHIEVLKLYPDAQLPRFDHTREDNVLRLTYISPRQMSSLAEGLIEASAEHFKTPLDIQMKTLDGDGSRVLFIITAEK